MGKAEALEYIAEQLLSGRRDLPLIKQEASKRFHLDSFIKNPDILRSIRPQDLDEGLRSLLLKKPAKTRSGVSPVAVMIAPEGSCRHSCIYCPPTALAAKSYTGFEPAAMRSIQHGFDARMQASDRVGQLESAGHETGKCEIIVMGGTFLQTPLAYRRSFIKGIYDGINGSLSHTLEEAISLNESAKRRVVGLTLETRPDVCVPYIEEALSYGATRMELGVQHADDRIYGIIRRGHSVQDVVDSTRALKDAAFKVLYHIMPGLPGSSPDMDIRSVKKLFEDPSLRPDMLKIYPTLVLEGTPLHDMALSGSFTPYGADEAADVISEAFRHIPPYVRVMRIQRDIPSQRISSGVKKSNLRELVDQAMERKGIVPSEIRSREAGLRTSPPEPASFSLKTLAYEASAGQERFLSFEDEDGLLAGFLRLRLPPEGPESDLGGCAFVRELHIYGQQAPFHGAGALQHRGLGARLLAEAESQAIEGGRSTMLIISGVGVREYYRRHGYCRKGPYMGKALQGLSSSSSS